MSLSIVTSVPASCSGDMYAGVPLRTSGPRMSSATPARPKSMITACPRPSSMMLAGFRSRCRTPLAWAAARPAQSCRAISTALSCGKTSDAAQERSQIFAVHIFHREKCLAVDVADVVDAAYIGMGNAARDADFIAEALEHAFVAGRLFGEKFHAPRPGPA